MFCRFLAETSTISTSPPQLLHRTLRSANSFFTRSVLASGLSTLLMATMIGTFAALECSMASTV